MTFKMINSSERIGKTQIGKTQNRGTYIKCIMYKEPRLLFMEKISIFQEKYLFKNYP